MCSREILLCFIRVRLRVKMTDRDYANATVKCETGEWDGVVCEMDGMSMSELEDLASFYERNADGARDANRASHGMGPGRENTRMGDMSVEYREKQTAVLYEIEDRREQ